MTTKQEELAALLKSGGVIPVLTIERLADAVPLARALVAGGVRVLEVTLPPNDEEPVHHHRWPSVFVLDQIKLYAES